MRCDKCGKEIPKGGSYFIKTLMIVCERCMVNIEPRTINITPIIPTDISGIPTINQCDGCWRVLPVNDKGMHFDPEDNNRVYIYCQAHNYKEVTK